MKRIRWKGELQWDDGEGSVLRSDTSGIFYTDYTGSEWAEITETEYDSVSRRIFLKVKGPEKRRTAMVEVEFPPEFSGSIVTIYSFCADGSYGMVTAHEGSELYRAFYSTCSANPSGIVALSGHAKPSGGDGRIPQELLDAIDPSAVHGGTRAILLVGDGGWAVKDFPAGVDTGRVELWRSPSVMEDRCSHDRVKPKGVAQ